MNSRLRRPFQGVAQIVRFNWPFYLGGLATVLVLGALVVGRPAGGWLTSAATLGLAGAAWLVFASLVVSHWVYDRSRLTEWTWIRDECVPDARRILHVHAGFDESSAAVRHLYPGAEIKVLDFYDPGKLTEASIARARAMSTAHLEDSTIDPAAWPVESGTSDAILILLAAHELRRAADRTAFFREAGRALEPGGRIVLAEHLRDAWNFAAYGPGWLHFLSHRTWLQAIRKAELKVEREFSITPFVRVFIMAQACSTSPST